MKSSGDMLHLVDFSFDLRKVFLVNSRRPAQTAATTTVYYFDIQQN